MEPIDEFFRVNSVIADLLTKYVVDKVRQIEQKRGSRGNPLWAESVIKGRFYQMFQCHNLYRDDQIWINRLIEQLDQQMPNFMSNWTNIPEVFPEIERCRQEVIDDVKKEYARICAFIQLDPFEIYKRIEQLEKEARKNKKKFEKFENIIRFLAEEIEELKKSKPIDSLPNLIDL